jgi:hypothetical protein
MKHGWERQKAEFDVLMSRVQTLQVECDDRHAPHRNARWYNPATSLLRAPGLFNLLDAMLIAVFGSDVRDR